MFSIKASVKRMLSYWKLMEVVELPSSSQIDGSPQQVKVIVSNLTT